MNCLSAFKAGCNAELLAPNRGQSLNLQTLDPVTARTMLQGGSSLLAGADVAHDLVKLLRIHLHAHHTHCNVATGQKLRRPLACVET